MLDIPFQALAAQAFTGLVLGGIYVLMAIVLAIRPQGLFPVRHG